MCGLAEDHPRLFTALRKRSHIYGSAPSTDAPGKRPFLKAKDHPSWHKPVQSPQNKF